MGVADFSLFLTQKAMVIGMIGSENRFTPAGVVDQQKNVLATGQEAVAATNAAISTLVRAISPVATAMGAEAINRNHLHRLSIAESIPVVDRVDKKTLGSEAVDTARRARQASVNIVETDEKVKAANELDPTQIGAKMRAVVYQGEQAVIARTNRYKRAIELTT